jgi:hypothetical protein
MGASQQNTSGRAEDPYFIESTHVTRTLFCR